MDDVLEYMKKHGVPLTRANYILLNWWGEYSADAELPAELEADLPEEFQLEPGESCD